MKTVSLRLDVRVADDVEPDDVAELVHKMLDIGYADAVETSENPEINSDDADLATTLEIERPVLLDGASQ